MKLPIASKFSVKLGNVLFFTWRARDPTVNCPREPSAPGWSLCLEVKTSHSLKGQEGALTSDVKKLHIQD